MALFYSVDLLPSAVRAALIPVIRVLIIPAWAAWDLGMIVTYPLRTLVASSTIATAAVTTLVLLTGLLPYALADAFLTLIRRRRSPPAPSGPHGVPGAAEPRSSR